LVSVRPNLVKRKWQRGEIAYGAWLTIPGAYSAEIIAHAGYDWACVDMQHGMIDYGDALTMLLAISTTDTMPFARVPWNEPSMIAKVLDSGAMGVIIPMVNTRDEARAAVAACLYPPKGTRSYGPGRVTLYAGPDYFDHANDEVAVIPMIETKEALANLDEILAVPGIDAVYFGPSDMSVSLGMAPRLENDGAWEQARQRIARSCHAHGVIPGVHASAALAAKHAAAGYRMIMITSEAGAMAARAREDLASVREVSPALPD
jgi:4-hydroxy-2-oxoheptanedioate aldolase